MKTRVISLPDKLSVSATDALKKSSSKVGNDFLITIFPATTPDLVDGLMGRYGLIWNYPSSKPEYREDIGLLLSPYRTANPKRRIACFLSHYLNWLDVVETGEPCLILEHDAKFVRRMDPDLILREVDGQFDIVGINNPLKATRKAGKFHDEVERNPAEYQETPWIDRRDVPQGLAGNSAYIITPKGAEALIRLVRDYGAWPNDAIMCKQLIPGRLGVTRTYYTQVQMLRSTTSN